MFIDLANILVKGGKGGDGAVSFRREKFVAAGGPDGGDGGKGGNLYFQADTNLSSLADFRYRRKFAAEDGENGGIRNRFGKSGSDLIMRVPQGTVVKEEGTGRVLADLSGEEPVLVAKGGRGGWGNQHFATATRQVPKFAKPGLVGEEFRVSLELKLLADVGLVGFPNVGKSSLITVVSGATPKVANYHFTTLMPNLGVVRIEEGTSFVMADIPGLVEGASDGVGLGHDFLRHVQRCRLILHLVDVSGMEGRDPIEDFKIITKELKSFHKDLGKLPVIAVANKADIAQPEDIQRFQEYIKEEGLPFYVISAVTRQGVDELMRAVAGALAKLPPILEYKVQELTLEELAARETSNEFTVDVLEDDFYHVEAPWLAQVLDHVNVDDYSSLLYFQRVLHKSGIIDKLIELGIQPGDTVQIFDFEFEYIP